jgi:indole-3-glycerol phosphate synthase
MNRDFLSEIVARKRQAIAKLRAIENVDSLRNRALVARANSEPHRLRKTLGAESPDIKVIAEFKRKSPSRGVIRADLSAADIARAYERGGASAISVLTDEEYFGGSIHDLTMARATTQLSILRKDFLIDPIQIYEAAVAGADAVLLIAAILDDVQLLEMRTIAEDELGLDALIEVHSLQGLVRAKNARAKLIGVNNRDLRTFEVTLSTSERLAASVPRDCLKISESGLQTSKQLRHLQALGFHGFLVGEALMQAADPAAVLQELMV